MPDLTWHSAEVLAPLAIGLAAGVALTGFLLYVLAPPPMFTETEHYIAQALGGLGGAWCALKLSRVRA